MVEVITEFADYFNQAPPHTQKNPDHENSILKLIKFYLFCNEVPMLANIIKYLLPHHNYSTHNPNHYGYFCNNS